MSEEPKISIKLAASEKCTGCGSCAAVCPRGAIKMTRDREGFVAPTVDADICIRCGICQRYCPELSPDDIVGGEIQGVYAAWHRDAVVRWNSSSGGAFSALAETVLERGGVVFGAAFDEKMKLRHIAVEDVEGMRRVRGSKYVQSDITGCFASISEYLKKGREVLFVGTSCQIAGLKKHFGSNYSGLICCDLVCHGVPSPWFFFEYLNWVEARLKRGHIHDYHFRDKHSGWYDALRYAFTDDGGHRMCGAEDCYFHAFNVNVMLRRCCYECRYKKLVQQADFTLGDFWGIGRQGGFEHVREIANGVSLILVHSDAGARLLKASESRLMLFPRTLEEAIASNHPLVSSVDKPEVRECIFETLRNGGFEAVRRRFLKKNLRTRIVSFIRERCPRRLVLLLRGRIP